MSGPMLFICMSFIVIELFVKGISYCTIVLHSAVFYSKNQIINYIAKSKNINHYQHKKAMDYEIAQMIRENIVHSIRSLNSQLWLAYFIHIHDSKLAKENLRSVFTKQT